MSLVTVARMRRRVVITLDMVDAMDTQMMIIVMTIAVGRVTAMVQVATMTAMMRTPKENTQNVLGVLALHSTANPAYGKNSKNEVKVRISQFALPNGKLTRMESNLGMRLVSTDLQIAMLKLLTWT